MKFFKKINRGLILTCLTVAAIVIYLVTLSMSQAKIKPVVEEVCEKYINTVISYKQLPDEYKKENPDISKDELDKYIAKMEQELKVFYTGNEQTYQYVIDNLKADLQQQALGMNVVYEYKKDIAEFDNFEFSGDTVTVTILTKSEWDGPNIVEPGTPREKIASQTTDTITLQKVDGAWKVIYSDIQQPLKSQNGMMYRVTNGF